MNSGGVPLTPGTSSPWPIPARFGQFSRRFDEGGTTATFFAPFHHLAVVTNLDVVEEFPNTNDSWTVASGPNSGFATMFWGGGVGTGAAGSFHDEWRGQVVMEPGGQLEIAFGFTMGSGGWWHFTASGYYLPLEPMLTFSGP